MLPLASAWRKMVAPWTNEPQIRGPGRLVTGADCPEDLVQVQVPPAPVTPAQANDGVHVCVVGGLLACCGPPHAGNVSKLAVVCLRQASR